MAQDSSNNETNQRISSYEEKVQKIADRIWRMWEKDLRNERERRDKQRR